MQYSHKEQGGCRATIMGEGSIKKNKIAEAEFLNNADRKHRIITLIKMAQPGFQSRAGASNSLRYYIWFSKLI